MTSMAGMAANRLPIDFKYGFALISRPDVSYYICSKPLLYENNDMDHSVDHCHAARHRMRKI